jgi:hypothetical protein
MLTPEALTRKYMNLYPLAAELVQCYQAGKDKGDFDWPSWCYMPVAASVAIIDEETQRLGLGPMGAAFEAGNMAAILAWRMTKGVYRFDPDLLSTLWTAELDREIPVEVFFSLPSWCCYIDLEGSPLAVVDGERVLGFFVYLESDVITGAREIRLSIVNEGNPEGEVITVPFHLKTGNSTLFDMFQGSVDYSLAIASPDSSAARQLKAIPEEEIREASTMYAPLFNLVLYLCSKDPDIIAPKRTRPVQSTRNPKKRKKNCMLPKEYRVGSRVGEALRRARETTASVTGTGARKAPHFRKPHWHLYWTGKGRKMPVVKLMDLIPVNIGKEPELPVVHPVR